VRGETMAAPKPQGTLTTGLVVGSRFPAFTLPDRHGDLVPFAATPAVRAVPVVVYRGADW